MFTGTYTYCPCHSDQHSEKKEWGQQAALPGARGNLVNFGESSIMYDLAREAVVESSDNTNTLTSILSSLSGTPNRLSLHTVKCPLKANETHMGEVSVIRWYAL